MTVISAIETVRFLALTLATSLATAFGVAAHAQERTTDVGAPGAEREAPALVETVDVRRVNLDVIVTDRDGEPVHGLTIDDFEVRLRGEPLPLTNFSEIGGESASEDDVAALAPAVVVLIDQRTGEAALRKSLVRDVAAILEPLLDTTRGLLVASLARRLEIVQPLTRDAEALRRALAELETPEPLPTGDSAQLLRQVEMARPLTPDDAVANDLAIRQARTLLAQIQAQAQEDSLRTTRAVLELRRLVRALSVQPSRTAILFLSGGLESTPSEVAFRMWWSKYAAASRDLGVQSIEEEMGRIDGLSDVDSVVADAANGRVSFYTLGLGRGTRLGGGAQFSSAGVLDAELQTLTDPLAALGRLADETGGLSALRAQRSGDLLDDLVRDLGHYYSLAFDPAELDPQRGRLRVRVRGDGLRVRSVRRYSARRPRDELEEHLMAALYLGHGDNPQGISIDVGKPKRSGRGRFVVSLALRIPVASVILLPDAHHHRGQLEVAVAARSQGGGSSRTTGGALPIHIPNDEVLEWIPRAVGSTLELEISDEPQTLGVAVRDAVGQTISTLQIALDPKAMR